MKVITEIPRKEILFLDSVEGKCMIAERTTFDSARGTHTTTLWVGRASNMMCLDENDAYDMLEIIQRWIDTGRVAITQAQPTVSIVGDDDLPL